MRVLIIGGGNIGYWHAKSIVKTHSVAIIEPNRKRRKYLSREFSEVYRDHYGMGLYDVAIIATCANERREALEIAMRRCKYIILEKFMFNDEREYNLRKNSSIIYCNLPRRAMDCYRSLKNNRATIIWHGFQGLLSNSVHIADLLCYYADSIKLEIDVKIKKRVKTKRKGYYDAEGRILIKCKDAFAYLATFGNQYYVLDDFKINEEEKTIIIDGKDSRFDFKVQSELTAQYLKNIENCGLTKYPEAAYIHLEILKALRKQGWNYPIT